MITELESALASSQGVGGLYERVRVINQPIRSRAMLRLFLSDKFEIKDGYHITLKKSNLIVGCLGNDYLELCWQEGKKEFYRVPHKHLRRIFRTC